MSSAPVKKACDACHRRKVRCSGGQPCKNCGSTSLQCTYLAIPQKKGPKGSRAKVISEIRDNQQQTIKTPTSPNSSHDYERNPFDFNASPMSPSATRNPELLTPQTIEGCVNFFFSHQYPTMPIFSRPRLADLINNHRENSTDVHCMIASLCAFIMVQPGMTLEGNASLAEGGEANARYRHANMLLDEIRRLRRTIDYIEAPTIHSVTTAFFLFGSYFCLEKNNMSWFYMREASTLAQIMGMHAESTYRSGDPVENMYKRRLYWLILATERAYAMERHRPLSLYATIELPSLDEEPQEAVILAGFLHLVNLYRLIDDEFMAVWNKAKSECSTVWLSQLQQQLADALPPDLGCTENQAADVKTTQHWLRTMVWQLSITNGYLSSSSPDVAMTFRYPIEIAKDLVQDLQSISQASMEVHGIGLIEKLFDVACTLTDVIAFVTPDTSMKPNGATPSEYLNQLLLLISRLRGGSSRYQPLLVAKVSENLPSLTAIHSLPSNVKTNFPSPQHNGNTSPLPTLAPAVTSKTIQPPSPYSNMAPFNDCQRGLMFDNYSPSVSDPAMTPITPAMNASPQATFGAHAQGQSAHNHIMQPPRSAPDDMHQVGYEGFHT